MAMTGSGFSSQPALRLGDTWALPTLWCPGIPTPCPECSTSKDALGPHMGFILLGWFDCRTVKGELWAAWAH